MVQRARKIVNDIAKLPTGEPLAPEAIVGVAFGTVVAVVEINSMLEDGAVLMLDELEEDSVVTEVDSKGTGLTIPTIVLVTAVGRVSMGTDAVIVSFEAAVTI